jgi:DNA uptake protein ComE-like DNA-binding protein
LSLPQRSRRLEAVSRVDLNAATAQDARALVGVDEENFLAIEN